MSLNQKNENMGGIFSPQFLFADEISRCHIVDPTQSMYFMRGQIWKKFPENSKIKMSVQPQDSNLYDVTCNIKIARPNITSLFQLWIDQMKMRPVVIRYKLSDGQYRVIGSKLNPLSVIVEDSTPQVTEFNGKILTFSGVQPHPQLKYEEF